MRLRRAPFRRIRTAPCPANKNGEGRVAQPFQGCSRGCSRFWRLCRRLRPGLSHPHHHPRGALSARRRRRRAGARRGREACRSRSVSRSWSTTAPAAPASSAPATIRQSAPDGYTLFLGHTGSISINPSLYANAGFDPRKDFAPIGLIASMPVALLAHPIVPGEDDRRRGRDREEGGRQAQHRHVGGRHRRLSLGRVVQVDHRRCRPTIMPVQGHRRS